MTLTPEVEEFLESLTKTDITLLMYYLTLENIRLKNIAEAKGLSLDNPEERTEILTEYHKQKIAGGQG